MSADHITADDLRELADHLDSQKRLFGEVAEVAEIALAINGASGKTDAVLTIAHDVDGSLEWETRSLALG